MKKNYYSAYNPSDYDWAKLYYLNHPLTIADEYPKDTQDVSWLVVLPSSYNQETKLIEKDNFLNLSEEAKEVVMTILNTPDELLGMLTTSKTGKFCKRYIKQFFKTSKKWNKKKTERIFHEVSNYVNEM